MGCKSAKRLRPSKRFKKVGSGVVLFVGLESESDRRRDSDKYSEEEKSG